MESQHTSCDRFNAEVHEVTSNEKLHTIAETLEKCAHHLNDYHQTIADVQLQMKALCEQVNVITERMQEDLSFVSATEQALLNVSHELTEFATPSSEVIPNSPKEDKILFSITPSIDAEEVPFEVQRAKIPLEDEECETIAERGNSATATESEASIEEKQDELSTSLVDNEVRCAESKVKRYEREPIEGMFKRVPSEDKTSDSVFCFCMNDENATTAELYYVGNEVTTAAHLGRIKELAQYGMKVIEDSPSPVSIETAQPGEAQLGEDGKWHLVHPISVKLV